ncbi:hypothetical protein E2C01_065150 [Portunus trituberculatus]|uniref:Uncharacterized protein n=1 Tax=Portunus trituberculatus TaxID=210409 RepID=A0A5B7HQA6_PORTR|nr:hypothetical protein [Portunus trituberculatus]
MGPRALCGSSSARVRILATVRG